MQRLAAADVDHADDLYKQINHQKADNGTYLRDSFGARHSTASTERGSYNVTRGTRETTSQLLPL